MNYFEETKKQRCERWLLNLLKQGAQKPSDVIELGSLYMGFSRSTIYSARKALGDQIENTDGYMSPFNLWKLAP